MKNLYFLFVFTLISSSVFSQSFFENKAFMEAEANRYQKMINYNVNPNTLNYDLKYQRLEVFLDPAVLQISGSMTSHFLPNASMSSIYFDLTNVLTVSEVNYHGTNLPFQQLATKEIKIDFPANIPANSLDSLTIKYSGTPDNSGRTSFYLGTHSGKPVLATLSEPYGAQNWFPTKQSLNDKIDAFDFKITTPNQYSVAANGKFMSETAVSADRKLTFWRTKYPTAAYLIALSIGDFVKSNDVIGASAFPYVNYLYPESAANPAIQANLEWTKELMTTLENYFGPYPFSNEKYGHMEFAVAGACMEHQTMSSMSSFGRPEIIHELGHQWFGDKITCGGWNDIWLNEGFAVFSENLVFEKNLMTEEQFLAHVLSQKNTITSLPGGKLYVSDSDLGSVATVFNFRLSYLKGGYVLRMMKWILGEDAFYQMIKDYAANPNFAYSYAKTDDFKNQIQLSTGKNLTEFFNDWIYGEGYPTYDIKWNQNVTNQNLNFLVSQTQSHPSVSFFEMPLPITVTGVNGEAANLVLNNNSNNQNFTEPINFQVASVEFNKNYDILERNSTVTFQSVLSMESVNTESLSIFPNPVKSELHLKGISKVSEYEIYFADGKMIKKGKYNPSQAIDVSKLSSGIYFIKINGKNFKFIKK